uniref:NADH-ubiquinone oxidoreductase chain 3 n=1 Tax=Unio pictorum TaxID=55837 RepID=A0A346HGV8_UNIPI|nr:NADH dehydrogenase subunit 3 [Unio pictorum]AXO78644.1 NADH dehydrogenase subunit 3 [Unio pictorum]
MVLISVVCSTIVGLMIFGLGLVLGASKSNLKSLSSPFECGFDPVGGSRVSFSLRFFVVMIIFVIFDFETVLLIPSVLWLKEGLMSNWSMFCFISFLVMLLIGIFFELKEGALQWKG